MLEVIPKHIKDVWDRWNIRGPVFLSLTLHAILVCFSPLRKRTPTRLLTLLLWSSYLLSDWCANFTIGLISKNQGKSPKSDDPPQDTELMALWAPFLLVHLAGPDTMTAFALEDNALWPRHVLVLVFQVIACVYVFLQSLPNSLWLIILLVFISGTIRYVEKIMIMHDASLDNLKDSMIGEPDPGPNYAKLMEEYKAKKEARLPTKIILIDEPDKEHRPNKFWHPTQGRKELHDLEIIHYAYKFFKTFKCLVVDVKLGFRMRDESLEVFRNLYDPKEALRIIEYELGLLHDVLFTKTNNTPLTKTLRYITLFIMVLDFSLFHKKPNKSREFHHVNVMLTYALFVVDIALDLPLLYSFYVAWSLRWDEDSHADDAAPSWKNFFLPLRRLHWKEQQCHQKCIKQCLKEGVDDDRCSRRVHTHHILATPFLLRKWCGNIYAFNFLAFATNDAKLKRIHDARGCFRRYSGMIISLPFEKLNSVVIRKLGGWVANMIDCVDSWISHKVNETSRKHPLARRTIYPFYFGFLSRIPYFINVMSKFLDIPDKLDQVRKASFVDKEPLTMELWAFVFKELKDKSMFGDTPKNAKRVYSARGEWTLRYNLPEYADREKLVSYISGVDYGQSLLIWHVATELCYQQDENIIIPEGGDEADYYSNREFSKILSDYMMYLLIQQPGMMSKVAGLGNIIFRDMLAEAKDFFRRRHIENKRDVKIASDAILDAYGEIDSTMGVKGGDRSESALFVASRLAKELERMEETCGKTKWEIVSKVWVELLCYAACHCEPTSHVEQLTRGAELINFVWFLMAHFGLVPMFQINDRYSRAKLIIGK